MRLRLENRPFGDQSGGEIAPQRHHQLACQGDDGDALDPFARVCRALTEPAAESTVRLMLQPQPSQLDGGVAGAAIAGLMSGSFAVQAQAANLSSRAGVPLKQMTDSDSQKKEKDVHSCKGMNSCKGKGGCQTGDNGCAGKNSCKGKGGCATDGSHGHMATPTPSN